MKKLGRPAENPKDPIQTMVSTRLSQDDIKKLDQCCEKLGVSRGKILRMGIDKVYAEIKE